MTLTTLIFIEACVLLVQAFFSGSEMAIISADKLALRKQANKGSAGAKLALHLSSHPEHVLSTVILGTNICVTLQATLVTLFIFHHYGPHYEIYATLVLSPIVLIFGELIPKTLFQRYSEFIAPRVARPVQIVRNIFSPIIWFIEKYAFAVSRCVVPLQEKFSDKVKTNHREELKYLLYYGKKEITLKNSERKMIQRIFDFSKIAVKQALIPLVQLDMIDESLTHAEALEAFLKFGHSRLPVYRDRVDNVVGVLHAFDVLSETNTNKSVAEMMTSAFFAPQSQQLKDLLFTIKKKGVQMVIAVDEYGGAVGALTLEDMLEKIVGNISDEFDHDLTQFKEISKNEYLIHARMEINTINEQLKLQIPKGDYETLAGFLLQQFNRIPEEGDELYYKNLKFVIKKASNRAIEQVLVSFFDLPEV